MGRRTQVCRRHRAVGFTPLDVEPLESVGSRGRYLAFFSLFWLLRRHGLRLGRTFVLQGKATVVSPRCHKKRTAAEFPQKLAV